MQDLHVSEMHVREIDAKTGKAAGDAAAPAAAQPDPAAQPAPAGARPRIRLHIWLESGDELFFGAGRAQLLLSIEHYGSLKKAAESMGMSYRAAWGKIRQSEEVLGVKLIARRGSRRDGVRLTRFGSMLTAMFQRWFEAVEQAALEQAGDIFPFEVQRFGQGGGDIPQP